MSERYVGRILPGNEVCDRNGKKVGTVDVVHRDDMNVVNPEHDEIVEVKTGLLGFGRRLYIPVSAIEDATSEAIFVAKPEEQFEEAWHHKPDYFGDLN